MGAARATMRNRTLLYKPSMYQLHMHHRRKSRTRLYKAFKLLPESNGLTVLTSTSE